jgi:hypothetical protein
VLFYNASSFRSDAYLRNCLLGRFLGNKYSDEHICFAMYFMIEVKDVWQTKQLDVWPLNGNRVWCIGTKTQEVVLLCIYLRTDRPQ